MSTLSSAPYPNLQQWPTSGLSFPWAEMHPGGMTGSFDMHLGPDGAALGMNMLIFWQDLATAVQQLLGYSYRVGPGGISRVLPWQHPYTNQLWVKSISSVKGVQLRGAQAYVDPGGGGVGGGYQTNTGPWTEFTYALLTLQFWRPPYYVRSDSDIIGPNGEPQEWLRYVDKHWSDSTQMLTRETGTFNWSPGQGGPTANFPGSVGQKLTKSKVTRTWYEVPEAAIFSPAQDQTPNGLPTNMQLTQTQTTNPITGVLYGPNQPIQGCVNSPIGGGSDDSDPTKRFFGCPIGTLLLEHIDYTPKPLQMPAVLMQIPLFSGSEPISQVQYDVTFHFDLFFPTRGPNVPSNWNGHNLMPYGGNALWYAVQSQLDDNGRPIGQGSNPALTPFMYADFSDLFVTL
jgi:hypothetical protein